jgi:hypothetical protein
MSIWERRIYEIHCDRRGCDDVWVGGTGSGCSQTWNEAEAAGWQFAHDLGHVYFCPEHKAIN